MAISTDSPTFVLKFTDGSFVTVLNGPDYITTSAGEYDLIYPNLVWSTFAGYNQPITKYDAKGNKYEFYSDGVTINDVDYRRSDYEGRMFHFVYNSDTDELQLWASTPLSGQFPQVSDNGEFINAWTYRGDCGDNFDSVGEMIVKGQGYMEVMRYGQYGGYDLRDVMYLTDNTPFNTVIRYVGSRASDGFPQEIRVNDLRFTAGGAFDLNLNDPSELLEDYDPIHPVIDTDDPFEPGGISGEDGGGGLYDDTSDPVDFPGMPSLSAVDTGFITLFNPSLAELRNLASYMWTGLFDIDNFRKIFANPMDCILGLSIVPVAVPDGGSKQVTVGNIPTGVTMNVAAHQYVDVNCGSIDVKEYWGAYLDYEPFTKAEIYLPYIGTHVISVDDIMKKTIAVRYHVDILSGSCTAYVKCGNSIIYEFVGQCSASIPICGNDWTNVINGALTIAGAIGTMVATGGAAAPTAAGVAATTATHNQLQMIQGGQTIASAAVNSLKPSIEKSGAMAGTGGLMGVQTPYLILTRPRQALPKNQNYYTGYPSFITHTLGSLSGFTIVENVHLEGIPGTNEEIVEIENLLKLGVIL